MFALSPLIYHKFGSDQVEEETREHKIEIPEGENMESEQERRPSLARSLSQKSPFNMTRRARPPPTVAVQPEERIPLAASQPTVILNRRTSKGGLRSYFSRNKLQDTTPMPAMAPVSEVQQTSNPAETGSYLSDSIKDATQSGKRKPFSLKAPAIPDVDPRLSEKPSRMTMRSKSTKSTKSTRSKVPTITSSAVPGSNPSRRSDASWDPPPLFQAYPQAIKHATLLASTLSADAILRISAHKRSDSSSTTPADASANVTPNAAEVKKVERAKSKHRRQVSGSISKADWTHKIFVLVTSGYLLQYAGEGSFDRLPEKMIKLGKDSVAFASDVIPGKHWVLQISQAMDSEGIPAPATQSLLSRLTFRGADYKRSATSVLLILNSADDLESWLLTVRREIEALGGKKQFSETGKPKADDEILQLKALPSPRVVTRDPDRFSGPPTPVSGSFGPPSPQSTSFPAQETQPMSPTRSDTLSPESAAEHRRKAADGNSVRTSHNSQDEHQLDNFRNNPNRFSYTSGERTTITSQNSSLAASPTNGNFPVSRLPLRPHTAYTSQDDVHLRPNAMAINERRRSMQQMHKSGQENHKPQGRPRPHSTYGYVKGSGPSIVSLGPRNGIIESREQGKSLSLQGSFEPSKPEFANKGVEKIPHLSSERALSSVQDVQTAHRHPLVYVPAETSFQMVQHARASVVEIPSRPHTASPTTTINHPPRRASMMAPFFSVKKEQEEFRHPRRYSSLQALSSKQSHQELNSLGEEDGTASGIVPTTISIDDQLSPTSPPPRTPLESFIPTPPPSRAIMEDHSLSSLPQLSRTNTGTLTTQGHRPIPVRTPMSFPNQNDGNQASMIRTRTGSSIASTRSGPPVSMTTHNQPPNRRNSALISTTTPSSNYQRPTYTSRQSLPRSRHVPQNQSHGQAVLRPTATNKSASRPQHPIQPTSTAAVAAAITAHTIHQSSVPTKSHLVLPNFQRLKQTAGPKTLVGRRGIPLEKRSVVVDGQLLSPPPLSPPLMGFPTQRDSTYAATPINPLPPQGPPPSCALPPLPRPGSSISKRRSAMGIRT